jgi:Fe-S cluster assembly protein SufD
MSTLQETKKTSLPSALFQDWVNASPRVSAFGDVIKDAAQDFLSQGIPTTKHEEWKYTNVTKLATTEFAFSAINNTLKKEDVKEMKITADAVIVVVENGIINKAASSMEALPKGIHIGSIHDLAEKAEVKKHFLQHADYKTEPFVALNTATFSDAVCIIADANVEMETPIQVMMVNTCNEYNDYVPVRILVVADKNASIHVVETFDSFSHTNNSIFVNAVSEVVLAENAKVNYVKLQDDPINTTHINYHRVAMVRDSYQHLTTLSLGGGIIRNNLNIRLGDVNGTAYLNGLTVARFNQLVDHHTVVDHAMPHCYSNELYKNIIDDSAQGVFNGKIFVRKDAQKTNAFQSNKNLLLSDDASMNAKPQLEIFADDVKCSHGATTGQLDDEALFYLRARGIGEHAARALLNHAFAADVIEGIAHEGIKEKMLELLNDKLK